MGGGGTFVLRTSGSRGGTFPLVVAGSGGGALAFFFIFFLAAPFFFFLFVLGVALVPALPPLDIKAPCFGANGSRRRGRFTSAAKFLEQAFGSSSTVDDDGADERSKSSTGVSDEDI